MAALPNPKIVPGKVRIRLHGLSSGLQLWLFDQRIFRIDNIEHQRQK